MYADQENPVRVTRASAKRLSDVAVCSSCRPPGKKKRVLLGKITNIDGNDHLTTPNRSRKKGIKTRGVVDTCHAPQMATNSIYRFLRDSEIETRPSPSYMESLQNNITAKMRSVLVDWLVEVAGEYKLASDTLFLTVSYIDRFLSSKVIDKKKFQLLGVCSLLVASKQEEITAPHAEELCYLTDNTYSKEEVSEMEKNLVTFLNSETSNPTTVTFLRRFLVAAQGKRKSSNLQLELLTGFLAELSLLDYGCLRFLPSQVAASVLFVARFTIRPTAHPWTLALQEQIGYNPSDLKDSIHAIHDLQLNKIKCPSRAVREKYGQQRFDCVSTLRSPEQIPSSFLEDLES